MQMTVGTVLVTVGLLLILSDLAALFAGPTSKNIRLELDVFQFSGIIVSTTDLYILLGIVVLTAGAASHPDADMVRPRGARR